MTLLKDIIRDAYREANLLPIGQDLSTEQEVEGFNSLIRIIDSVFGNEVGEELFPIVDETAEVLFDNSILLLTPTSLSTYYFPSNPRNGSRIVVVDSTRDTATYQVTLHGNTKTIENSVTSLFDENGISKVWFYNAEKGDWIKLSSLTSVSESILPPRFDDYFIIALAMRLNPRNGMELSQQSLARFKEVKRKLQAEYRYSNSEPLEKGLSHLTSLRDYIRPTGKDGTSNSPLLAIYSLPLAP